MEKPRKPGAPGFSLLSMQAFFFAGGCLFFEKMGLGALTQRKVLKFNRCLCSGSHFIFF